MRNIFFISILAIAASCAPARFVEPLKEKEFAIGANTGGPLINYGGTTIPVPLSAVYAGYGIDSTKTVFAGIHTTSMLFGNFQMDLGGTFKVLNQNKFQPNISISPAIQFITSIDKKVSRLWPNLGLNSYWNYGKRHNYFYVGIDNWFVLSATRSYGEPSIARWVWNPQIGHTIKSKNSLWNYTLEWKWLAPNFSHKYSFVPYANTLGSTKGASGIYFTVTRTLKRKNS